MNELLAEHTEQLTVKIIDGETKEPLGTGFFLGRGCILTCRHCIESQGSLRPIMVNHFGNLIAIDQDSVSKPNTHDYALLYTKDYNGPNTLPTFNEALDLEDTCFTFGYTSSYPKGESSTFIFEGNTITENGSKLFKLKDGQAQWGQSGSPVLNLSTGSIIGMIQISRNPDWPIGARILPIQTVLNNEPLALEIVRNTQCAEWEHPSWMLDNEALKLGIGRYDHWLTDNSHKFLFPLLPFMVNEVFVEPNYSIAIYNDLTLSNQNKPKTKIINDAISILKEQKILFIIGRYGCGKTITAKMIHRQLIINGYDTIYLNCIDIAEYISLKELVQDIDQRRLGDQPFYLIVDNYDEINYLQKSKQNKIDDVLMYIVKVSQNRGMHILVNSRYISYTNKDLLDDIVLYLNNIRNLQQVKFIEIEYFTNFQLDKYLDRLSFLWEKHYNRPERLTREIIKRTHKSLIEPSRNPLLLYMLVDSFYKNGVSSIKYIYDRYEEFIDKTIKGKFGNTPYKPIEEIAPIYREFLTDMAIKMTSSYHNYNEPDFETTLFSLSSNEENLWIEHSEVAAIVASTASRMIQEDNLAELKSDRITANSLACYFFENSGTLWRYKDDNVAYYLIAERVFNILEDTLTKQSDGGSSEVIYNTLIDKIKVPLRALWIRMLLYRLNKLSLLEKKTYAEALTRLIKDGLLIKLSDKSIAALTIKKAQIDIFLSILLLQLNNESFYDLPYLLKGIHWHLNAIKIIDDNTFSIIRRFTAGAKITHVKTNRVSYEGFNFDNSQLRDSEFVQVYFENTRFNYCIFSNTTFKLCEFRTVSLDSAKGNLSISHSWLTRLSSKKARGLKLVFNRCFLKDLKFEECDGLRCEMRNCHISGLHVLRSSRIKLYLENCFFDQLKLGGSDGVLEENECRCISKPRFSNYLADKIRHIQTRILVPNSQAND